MTHARIAALTILLAGAFLLLGCPPPEEEPDQSNQWLGTPQPEEAAAPPAEDDRTSVPLASEQPRDLETNAAPPADHEHRRTTLNFRTPPKHVSRPLQLHLWDVRMAMEFMQAESTKATLQLAPRDDKQLQSPLAVTLSGDSQSTWPDGNRQITVLRGHCELSGLNGRQQARKLVAVAELSDDGKEFASCSVFLLDDVRSLMPETPHRARAGLVQIDIAVKLTIESKQKVEPNDRDRELVKACLAYNPTTGPMLPPEPE